MMGAAAWNPLDSSLWPSTSQLLLLRALLLDKDSASRAWRDWCARYGVEGAAAGDHALFPSLYLTADRIDVEPAARAALREAYMTAWARNTTALALFRETVRRFASAGVPVVALKGVPLLLFHYRDAGARPMADVDALIQPGDLAAAADVLRSCGWEPTVPVPPADVAAYVPALTWRHGTGTELDLHWRPFTTDCPVQAERRFWERSEERDWDGLRIRVPAATDLLIMMCFHGRRQDLLAEARWVLDVVRLLDGEAIDWDEVVRQSLATGLAAPVDDALRYLREVHAVDVPEDQRLASTGRGSDARMRYFELVRQGRNDRGLLEAVSGKWWQYASVQRAGGAQPTWHGFASYYLADRQWEWELERASQVLGRSVTRLIGRIRVHGF